MAACPKCGAALSHKAAPFAVPADLPCVRHSPGSGARDTAAASGVTSMWQQFCVMSLAL